MKPDISGIPMHIDFLDPKILNFKVFNLYANNNEGTEAYGDYV